ncbi:MAG: sortase [Nitrososphaerales archaeon]
MRFNGTRSVGTVLMGIGLLLILSVIGYFAWTEVQASQVRNELEQTSAAAAARATRIAKESDQATPALRARASGREPANSAQLAASAKAALTATRRPILPAPSSAPTQRPSATATRPSPTAVLLAAAPKPTQEATAAPAPTAAPVLPVRLQIPDLKIDTPVVEMGWNVVQTKNGPVSEWAIPKNAAGHHLNSATIGQPDNLVISGHNNIFGRVFMPISQAWTNDGKVKVDNFTDRSHVLDGRELVLFDVAGHAYKYVITDFYRLRDSGVSQQQRETNARYILPTNDERITIVTCWPPTNNTHRLIVIARPER